MNERYVMRDAGSLIARIKEDIPAIAHNPSLMVQRKVQLLEAATLGELDVVDATNPFMHLICAGTVVGSGILAEMENINRKMYPNSAQRLQELLPHMSDKDFADLFARPDRAGFYFIYRKQELIDNMVEVAGSNIRKIVIPRNTMVRALDTTYSLEYPIEIRQMNHDGLQIVWDMDKPAPFASIQSNQIQHHFVRDPDTREDLLIFKVDLSQFEIRSITETANEAMETIIQATFKDNFCLARVWLEQEDKSWMEIGTTYTDINYPLSRPTAVVQVIGNICQVQIPLYYISSGLVRPGGRVRVDIYQTKGPVSQVLSSYSRENYTIEYNAIDPADKTIYQAPVSALGTAIVFSEEISYGGRNGMTFEAIQERVITNAIGSPDLPITPVQAAGMLVTNGYQVIQKQDSLTNRTYLATKKLPTPSNPALITAANGGIHTIVSSLDDMATRHGVVDNRTSLTITPDALYRVVGSNASLVMPAEFDHLNRLPRDQFAVLVSGGEYFYSPFHYVVDNSNPRAIDCRAYYLDDPQIVLRNFVDENDTTLLQVGIGSTKIARSAKGYKLHVLTKSSDQFKELNDGSIYAQIAFASDASGKLTYMNGVQISKNEEGERVFEFEIVTSFNLNLEDQLELTSFQMITQSDQIHYADLETTLSVIFSTSTPMPAGYRTNNVDAVVGTHLLPFGVSGINHETITVRFGTALKNLWSKCRVAVDAAQYETYLVDVPLLHKYDKYEVDPVTGSPFSIVNGEIVRNLIAAAGDPVLDEQGRPVMEHMAGDIIYQDGQPVIARNRTTINILDIFLIEGVYRFANNDLSVEYRKHLVDSVVNWVSRDLAQIEKRTLEQTEVFFYPVHATGAINVMHGEGLRSQLEATQSFTLRLYVTDQIYRNTELRATLERASIEVLERELSKRTVSVSAITKALEAVYGEDVISFDVSRLGPNELTLVTVIDEGRSLSLRKALQLRNDDSLAVREDVTVEFRRHQI